MTPMAKATSKSALSKKICEVVKPEKTAQGITSARAEKVTMGDLRDKAYGMGLSLDGLTVKADIIRAIQTAEGYQACFATKLVETCGQKGCRWREECRG